MGKSVKYWEELYAVFSNLVKELKVKCYEWVILNVIMVTMYDFP